MYNTDQKRSQHWFLDLVGLVPERILDVLLCDVKLTQAQYVSPIENEDEEEAAPSAPGDGVDVIVF